MLEQESSEQSKALIGRGADEMDLLKICADFRGYVVPGGLLHTDRRRAGEHPDTLQNHVRKLA